MSVRSCLSLTVMCLVFYGLNCQDELELLTDAGDAPTDLICKKCNCTDTLVDCTDRGIQLAFELNDWEGLKELNPTTVNLSFNPLTTISRIASLNIRTLNVSNCELSSIDDASFVYLSELETLDLSNNQLSTSAISRRVFVGPIIDGTALHPFDKMRYLSLANNDIHSLPQDLFTYMSSLTTLDLSGNPLAYIDQVTMAAITDLNILRELYLSSCELESLPEGMFRRQRRLIRLDLSNNRFTTIPSVLNEATNLIYLNFGKNPIQKLESVNPIRNLTKLQELRLCRNSKLQSIAASALGGLPDLVSLHICYNPRLTTIDPDFLVFTDDHEVETWPMLKQLYLNNNNITTINSNFLHRWDKLTAIDVTNNPYVCDCTNQWVVDVLIPLMESLGDDSGENMICKKPSELRGASFTSLHASSRTLTCADAETIIDIPVPDMAILMGIMIGIFVTFPLVLVVILLWRKGYFAKCRSAKPESDDEETDAF